MTVSGAPAATALPKNANIRGDTVVPLSAVGPSAEGREHFVVYEDDIVGTGLIADKLHVLGVGDDATLVVIDRLHDDTADLVAVLAQRSSRGRPRPSTVRR